MSDSNSPVKVDVGVKLQGSLTPGWKSLDKVTDTLARGIGAVGGPFVKLANALSDSAIRLIGDSTDAKLVKRAASRLLESEIRRQANIESITAKAVTHLPETVSPDPVNPDWVTRFLNAAQDASDEQLQEVWARLLASEIKQPGSISRRTLSVVNDLSPNDAKLFAKIAPLAWRRSDGVPVAWVFAAIRIALFATPSSLRDELVIPGNEKRLLVEAGLLETGDVVEYYVPWGTEWILGKHRFSVASFGATAQSGRGPLLSMVHDSSKALGKSDQEDEQQGAWVCMAIRLTTAGAELLRVCDQDPPMKYLEQHDFGRLEYIRASWLQR